jgi:hypothetical protein
MTRWREDDEYDIPRRRRPVRREEAPPAEGLPPWAIGLGVGAILVFVLGLVVAVVFLVRAANSGPDEWADVPPEDDPPEQQEFFPPAPAPRDGDVIFPAPQPPLAGRDPADLAAEMERPEPAAKPFDADPALRPGAGTVYLSDMHEFAYKPGPAGWGFGKNGDLATVWNPGGKIVVNGKVSARGLSMHPPSVGYTRVCYALGRKAKALHGAAAISEDENTPPHPTRFVVLGDGKVLWRSESVRAFGTVAEFTADVSAVDVLELRTYVEGGDNFGSHAVWLDPRLTVK